MIEMKIVHLCLCGPVTDGWTYQDNLLSKYHRKAGHDVTIITSQWIWGEDGKISFFDKTNYFNSDDVKTIRLPIKKGNVDSKFKRYIGLYEAIDCESPNILFVHGCQFLDMPIVVKYLKKHPQVTTYVDNHADFSNSATNPLSKIVLHSVIWRHQASIIMPYTKKFYGVLPVRVDFLKDVYKIPAEKCELLVMGTEDELVDAARDLQITSALRKEYGINENDFLVMTGGKIDAFKTQTLLLMDAVNQIDDPCVKLIVFGSVSDELKDEVNRRCSNKVQYIGWIQAKDSCRYFASAQLVVFPGRHSVFWEQVAGQGVPMLCKSWDGTHHVDVGGNVIFLYNDSIEEIRECICHLVTEPEEYNKMQKVAESKGKTTFSYADIAARSIN